jgi:hypothetical protein
MVKRCTLLAALSLVTGFEAPARAESPSAPATVSAAQAPLSESLRGMAVQKPRRSVRGG